MKKKGLGIVLATVLVLSLGLVFSSPVGASPGSITIVSGTATQTAGYTTSNPSADPLNSSLYSVPGWTSAVAVGSPVIPPWVDPSTDAAFLGSGAVWVSTTAGNYGNDLNIITDSWRLFKADFTIPCNVVVNTAQMWLTADNAFELYFNGSSIASTDPPDTVFGLQGPPYPFPRVPPYPFQQVYGPYNFTPVGGTNSFCFVVRNWDNTGSNTNPTGLLYRADIDYTIPSIETLTQSSMYNPVCTDHTVTATIDPAAAGIEVTFVVTGANAQTGTGTTNASGVATFTYHGDNPGIDSITAYIDLDCPPDGQDGEDPVWGGAPLEKYWLMHFVTGGGNINRSTVGANGNGKQPAFTFGGNVGYLSDGTLVGQFQINDHLAKKSWHCHNDWDYLIFDLSGDAPAESPYAYFDKAEFKGEFTSNKGDTATIRIRIIDFGEPGKGVDKFGFVSGLAGFEVKPPQLLDGGNLQVHEGWK